MARIELHFPDGHPVGPGHFPGNPIIPGALLLAEAVRLIAQELNSRFENCTVKSAKFFHPVRPGDTVEIEFSVAAQEIRFQCAVGASKVLAGAMNAAA